MGQAGKKHDVVMGRAHAMKKKQQPYDRRQLIRKSGFTELDRKAENHGFSYDPNNLRISGYRQQQLYRPGKRDI